MLIYTLGSFLLSCTWIPQGMMHEESNKALNTSVCSIESSWSSLKCHQRESIVIVNHEHSIIGYRYLGNSFPSKGDLCRIIPRGDGLWTRATRPHGLHRVVLVEFALPDYQAIKYKPSIDQDTFGGIIRGVEPQERKGRNRLEGVTVSQSH